MAPGSALTPLDINFVIIGATKSATTWLQRHLQSIPGIYMPGPELHYFSRSHEKGTAWYLDQFAPPSRDMLVGEKSNSYLETPNAAKRMNGLLPHARLVAQLRNPVERAYSDYCMLFRRGEVDSDIRKHLDPRLAADGRFLRSGDYASLLEPFIDVYGREPLLVLFYDQLVESPGDQLSQLYAHISINNAPAIKSISERVKDRDAEILPLALRRTLRSIKPLIRPLRGKKSFEIIRSVLAKRPAYPPLGEDLKLRMTSFYRPRMEALEHLLGQPLPGWK